MTDLNEKIEQLREFFAQPEVWAQVEALTNDRAMLTHELNKLIIRLGVCPPMNKES